MKAVPLLLVLLTVLQVFPAKAEGNIRCENLSAQFLKYPYDREMCGKENQDICVRFFWSSRQCTHGDGGSGPISADGGILILRFKNEEELSRKLWYRLGTISGIEINHEEKFAWFSFDNDALVLKFDTEDYTARTHSR